MSVYTARELAKPLTDRAHRKAVPRSDQIVGFAPCSDPVCVSKAGRERKKHTFDRDGRCLFCAVVME